MKIQFKVPNIVVYHELFHSLGCTGSRVEHFHNTYDWFNISDTKQLEGNNYPQDKYQNVSIKEAIEFCVTGKWPEPPKLYYQDVAVGQLFRIVGNETVWQKMDSYFGNVVRVVRKNSDECCGQNGQYGSPSKDSAILTEQLELAD